MIDNLISRTPQMLLAMFGSMCAVLLGVKDPLVVAGIGVVVLAAIV